MTIWVPPQEKSTKQYVRWTTNLSFVIFMLWLVSFFYDEYSTAERVRVSALKTIEEVNVKNAEIEEHNNKVEEHNKNLKERVIKKKIQVPIVEKSEPIGGGSAPKAPELPSTTSEQAIKSIPDSNEPIAGGSPMPPPPRPAPLTLPAQKTCSDLKEAMRTGCYYVPPTKPRVVEIEVEEKIPPPPPIEKQSKIEIDAGIVKVAMSNEASWMAIMKMIFTVLFTFFGIRLINFGFKKLEGEPKPA